MLVAWTNWLVVITGLAGFFTYVVLYGMLSKRMSVHGTLVGSISGAAPIFAGYVAVTGSIDAAAVLVFLAIFFWQMPEFYSIAVYRRDEYARAGVCPSLLSSMACQRQRCRFSPHRRLRSIINRPHPARVHRLGVCGGHGGARHLVARHWRAGLQSER